MSIVAILQQKGGVGRTTLSTNIAWAIQSLGHSVSVVDQDPQASTRYWNKKKNLINVQDEGFDDDKTFFDNIEELKTKSDKFIIIDGSPRIEKLLSMAVRVADFVLIPVQPSGLDYWATKDLIDIVNARQSKNNANPKCSFVVSRAMTNTKLSEEIGEDLLKYGHPVFKSFTTNLGAYPSSISVGETVFQNKKFWVARNQIEKITNELLEICLC